MKKLLSVSLLMLCLSFPVFGGHNVAGGSYCDPCDNITCICDGHNGRANSTQDESSSLGSEVMLSFFVLLMLLRYKA
jgi:hypothetical protein